MQALVSLVFHSLVLELKTESKTISCTHIKESGARFGFKIKNVKTTNDM